MTHDRDARDCPRCSAASCGAQYPVEPLTICEECFGPLEPAYDLKAWTAISSARQAEAGPYDALALRVPPAGRTRRRARRPGSRVHAAAARGQSRRAPGSATALDQGRQREPVSNSFKDRVVSRGRDHGPRVRLRGGQLRVHREPRQRHRGPCGEGGHAVLRVRAGRPRAGEDPRHRGVRREGRRGEGQLRRREPSLQRGRGDPAVGVREREHAAVLRRGLEVARDSRPRSSSAGGCRITSWYRSRRARCSRRSIARSAS